MPTLLLSIIKPMYSAMFNSDWFYEHIIYDLIAMVTKAQDGKVKIWILIYHIWLKEGTMNCEMQNLILHYTSSLYLFIETCTEKW